MSDNLYKTDQRCSSRYAMCVCMKKQHIEYLCIDEIDKG